MGLLPGVERIIAELDPNLPISDARDMEAVRADSLARERFMMLLLVVFSIVALVLAIVGIYGVVAQFTRQRSQEISVRLALGAQPADVRRMIVSRGAMLVGSGIGIGLIIAVGATRAMSTMLFQVKPLDPTTFLAVAGVLAATGVVASWVPARRASRMDPGSALRPE